MDAERVNGQRDPRTVDGRDRASQREIHGLRGRLGVIEDHAPEHVAWHQVAIRLVGSVGKALSDDR